MYTGRKFKLNQYRISVHLPRIREILYPAHIADLQRTQRDLPEMIFFWCTRAGTVILAILMASIVASRIAYPFDTGYLEAFSWVPAAHLLEGKNPYSFALTPPYSMAPYGVIYYALLALGQSVFGLQMWFGRILSLLACAVCIWAVARITKKFTARRDAVTVACLLSLAFVPVQAWVGVMRPDLISIAFGLTAVSVVLSVREHQRMSGIRMTAVVLLSAAAVFTKHTTLLPAAIIAITFLQLNRRRDALVFGAGFLLVAAAAVLVLNVTSGGGYVWQHFVHAERLPFSFPGWQVAVLSLFSTPTILCFAAAFLFFAYVRRKTEFGVSWAIRSPGPLLLFYFLLSLTVGLISSGRVGSNVNYFLEASFVLAIVGGLISNYLRGVGARKIAAAMVVLMVVGGAFQLSRYVRGEFYRWEALSYYREISDTARKYIQPGSTCVSVYADLVVPHGCALHYDDYGEYVGGWSPELTSVFEKEVAAGRYAVIIWDSENMAEKFAEYRLVPMSEPVPERFFPVYLYVPKTNPGTN